MVFLPRALSSFLQIHEKLEMCQKLNLTNSKGPSFQDDINVTFTLPQPVPWILNNFAYFTNFIQ